MYKYLILFIVSFSFSATAQKKESQPFNLFTPDTLQMDLDTLYTTILKTHPDIDAYRSIDEIKQGYLDIRNQLTEPMTQHHFYTLLNPWYAAFGDAHMNIKMSESRFDYLMKGGYFTSLKVKIINDKFFLEEDVKKGIHRGSQVASFNGVPASKIYETLIHQINHDGAIPTTRHRLLEFKFNTLLPLFFEVKEKNELTFLAPGTTEKKTIELKGIKKIPPKLSKKEKKEKAKKEAAKLPYSLKIDAKTNTATLTITSFGKGSAKKYYQFLKTTFKIIEEKNIQHLILDLRDNGGGSADRGSELLAYLAKKHFTLYPKNIIRSSALLKTQFSPFWSNIFFKLTPNKKHSGMRFAFYSDIGKSDTTILDLVKPIDKSYHFDGDTYLLVNGASASTTALFANVFRNEKLGTIIGEMPGGTANGTFGQAKFFTLPYTKIQARIACIRFLSSNDYHFEAMGIEPDYIEVATLKEWIMHKDKPMDKAIELISQKP